MFVMKRIPLIIMMGVISTGLLTFCFVHKPLNQNNVCEKRLCVVIPSYNNADWYKKNLDSIFSQKFEDRSYENYHVIYIVDNATDNTYDLVKKYIYELGKEYIVTLINNKYRKGALENLYFPIHTRNDREIIVTIDGDDWLYHDRVFEIVNEMYDEPIVFTYGQYTEYPRMTIGNCREMPDVVKNNSYRTCPPPWGFSHLRTFYAGLFKRIKKEDLLYNGEFFKVTGDLAFLFPLLEMAGGKIKFIPDILYVYNQANPINDYKIRLRYQLYFDQLIRSKEPYKALSDEEIKLFANPLYN